MLQFYTYFAGKKPRTSSKDLRKTLGRLKVMEMASNPNNISCDSDCISPELLASKVFGLPSPTSPRSDPTVLKSLRAFRPNAHKTKNNEFFQNVTENCYNSKTLSGKVVPNKKATVFDCNDNKFITKGERFSFGNKDMEIHFRTGGVKTKKYNDVIRTIKEDLISVSNIPCVTNNATVNVVHIHDTLKLQESSSNVQSTTSGFSVSSPSNSTSVSVNLTSCIQKPKAESESQGSQAKKSTSSQSFSQNALTTYPSSTSQAATILTAALTRVHPSIRPSGICTPNQFFTSANPRPSSSNKGTGQPQFMAIVNRNSLNQSNASNSSYTIDSQNVPNSVVSFMATNTTKIAGQNYVTQATRTPVQTARVVAVHAGEASRFILERDRPNVVLSKNYGLQNVRTGTPSLYNHVSTNLNNGASQIRKIDDTVRSSVGPVSTSVPVEGTSQSTSRLSFASTIQNISNPTKVTIINSKPVDVLKSSNETTCFNVVSGINSNSLNTSKPNTLRLSTEGDSQFFQRNSISKISGATTVVPNRIPPQTLKVNNAKTPHTVILQTNVSVANRTSSLSNLTASKRSCQIFSNPLVKLQASNNVAELNASQNVDAKCLSNSTQENGASRSGFINNISDVSLTLDVRNISSGDSTGATALGDKIYASSNLISNKSVFTAGVSKVQGGSSQNQDSNSNLEGLETEITSVGNPVNRTTVESGDVVTIVDSSPSLKIDTMSPSSTRNILATVLKRNAVGRTSTTSTQYSQSSARNPIDLHNQNEVIQNVIVSQNSNSSTIHYTVVNPVQQDIHQNSLNPMTEDIMVDSQQSIMSPIINQIETSDFGNEISTMEIKNLEKYGSLQDLNSANQSHITSDNKIALSNSSPSVQTESVSYIKKQVLNNQKITILVQNNEEEMEKKDSEEKSKLNEMFKEDKKNCITFRAIKRSQSEVNQNGSPSKKKGLDDSSGSQNTDTEGMNSDEISMTGSGVKTEVNSCEPLCQYLVLEAINDPAGALPKFNQAFGKSYQVIKIYIKIFIFIIV